MNKTALALALLAMAIGVFLVIYGEYDDSPGGQLLGLLVAVAGIAGVIKNMRKNSR